MAQLRSLFSAGLVTFTVLASLAQAGGQQPLSNSIVQDACPDYSIYSRSPHRPLSLGPLALPYQRPNPRCRTFQSQEIERVIKEVTSLMKDPDLAKLFENAFPSTTDTTVKFHTNGNGSAFMLTANDGSEGFDDEGRWNGPHSFIITGDIVAEWLRDSTNQLSPYQALAKKDPAIFNLILGAIATQAEYVIESPYCNAFQPPPISNLPVSFNGQDDTVRPAYEPNFVFECKWELDSLAHFLTLANDFYQHTNSTAFMTERWLLALKTVLIVLNEQSRPTFDPDTGDYVRNEYTFRRNTNIGTETLNLNGVGNPLNHGTGLVRSAFRPSDDATILGFLIPSNAMMSVEAGRTEVLLRLAGQTQLAEALAAWSDDLRKAVWKHGVVQHKKYGPVFAYEVDGYGSSIIMDDANYPSLLALPKLGFLPVDDATYQNTRKMLLDKSSNPYYLKGPAFEGIGGPHIGLQNAWPMSVLIQAQTSTDDAEILECLQRVTVASELGLVHESIDVTYISSYTRSWFAWANGVFAETILDIAKRKPHLIFEAPAAPYKM